MDDSGLDGRRRARSDAPATAARSVQCVTTEQVGEIADKAIPCRNTAFEKKFTTLFVLEMTASLDQVGEAVRGNLHKLDKDVVQGAIRRADIC